jgi:hypothetical protein
MRCVVAARMMERLRLCKRAKRRVARMERSGMRDNLEIRAKAPDCAALHPGYTKSKTKPAPIG